MHFSPPAENAAVYPMDPATLLCWDSIAYKKLAMGAMVARDYENAAALNEMSVALAPADTANLGLLYCDLGLARLRAGDLAGSNDAYERALEMQPFNHEIRYGAACALLQAGDFTRGWALYHSRSFRDGVPVPKLTGPVLTSPPTAGMRVVVWTDQGVGDRVMMASLVADLAATGAIITLLAPGRLVRLFQRSFPEIEVYAEELRAQLDGRTWDGVCALGDTARWFRPDFASFPGTAYLKADAPLTACLRRRYLESAKGKPLIGVSWRTLSPKFPKEKSIPLAQWREILAAPAGFVSLQYGDATGEIAAAGAPIAADDRIDPAGDLDLFAAQVAAMDLVITTSNATAHLAGALGVPCLVLTARGMGDMWHWFMGREDSPFYASVRVVRQVTRGRWTAVMRTAAILLECFLETGSLWEPDETASVRDGG